MAAKVEGEVERVQEVGCKGKGRSLLVNLAASASKHTGSTPDCTSSAALSLSAIFLIKVVRSFTRSTAHFPQRGLNLKSCVLPISLQEPLKHL